MFGLGIVVGRGSSPVLFETRPFQERLGQMVRALAARIPEKEKVDLKFYDVLNEPVYHPVKGKTADSGEITPGPETGKSALMQPALDPPRAESVPVKRSKKLMTWHQAGQGNDGAPVQTSTGPGEKQTATQLAPGVLKPKKQPGKKTDTVSESTGPDTGNAPASVRGAYTIQVASYKDLNDALSQMVLLNKKGIAAYRASVTINGDTWHRVRTGAFADYKAARTRLAQLAGSGVDGMVIKKD